MNNPYIWNAINTTLFYGKERLDILVELIDGLTGNPRFSFGVTGSRRMGKTTLLRRLEQDLKDCHRSLRESGVFVIPIYIDGLALPRPLTAEQVWFEMLQQLFAALPDTFPQPSEHPSFADFKQYIQPILSNLPEQSRIIVLFDEIEPIIVCDWSAGFFAQWRALLSNTPGLDIFFTAVFSGAREMAELQRDIGSPLKDSLEWRMLQILDFEDSCLLMQEPIETTLPDEFLNYAYHETGGHPMILQYLMQKICASSANTEPSVTLLQKTIRQFERDRSWQFEEWWHRYNSSTGRRIYASMPDDRTTVSRRQIIQEFGFSEANPALEILQHVGLIVAIDDGMFFHYAGEMFRRWYRHNGFVEQIVEHDPQVYSRLQTYEQKLADRYLTAWKICQADLPNYSGAVVEIRETITLLLEIVAPKPDVASETGFQFERGETQPTRRQRVRYIVRKQFTGKMTEEIESDYMLLETLLSQLVVDAHKTASTLTHTTATRERAFEILKRWDAILKHLLPEKPNYFAFL